MEKKIINKYAYIEVASNLRNKIISGKLSPGEMICSEAEMCEQFGVSRGPVRQAMRSLVDEGLVARMPGKGTFVRDIKNAKALKIAVLLDLLPENSWSRFLQDIIQGLRLSIKQMNQQQCSLSFLFQSFAEITDYEYLNGFANDGIIFVPITTEGVNFVNRVKPTLLNSKVVSYYRKTDNPRISQFYMDHEIGAFRVTKYLLGQGQRRIAFLTDSSLNMQIDSDDRIKGCLRAYKDMNVSPDFLHVLKSGSLYESIANDLDRMFSSEKCEALLLSGELFARNVMRFVETRNFKIPEDMSVVVFDDCEEFATYSPKLTAVRQVNQLGTQMTLERLLNEIRNPVLPAVSTALKPELVIRDSCKNLI